MWKLYMKSEEGIAVETMTPRFISALAGTDRSIHLGKVRYIDYDNHMKTLGRVESLELVLHKRKNFSHEREVRAFFVDDRARAGVQVPVDLQVLIRAVWIAPKAPPWIGTLVEKMLRRYGVDVRVARSRLATPPLRA